MKRSEMIKLLSKKLICPHVILYDGIEKCFESKAEYVLEFLEKIGMSPPTWSNHNPSKDERMFSSDGYWCKNEEGKTYLICNGWEPE